MIKTYEMKLAELENLKEGDLITTDEGFICKYIKHNKNKMTYRNIKFGIALPTQKRSLVLEMLKNIISEFKFFTDAEPNKIEEHEIKNLFFNFLLDKNISYTSREARKRVLLGKKPFYIYFNKILTGLSSEKANSYSLNRSIEFIYNLYLQNNKFYPYLLKSVFNNLQFK